MHSCPSPTSCTSATAAPTAGAAATAAAASRRRNGPSDSTPEHTHSTHWNSTHDDGQSSLSGTSPGAAIHENDKPSVSSTTRAANQHDRGHDGDGSAEVHATDSRHGLPNLLSVFNCQGLLPRIVPNKVPYISDLLHDNNHLFMALTETWLHDHKDAELYTEGYKFFRQDRSRTRRGRGRNSGGVAAYVREDIAVTMEPVINYSSGFKEILGLHSKVLNFLVIVIYRQPDDIAGGHCSTGIHLKQALGKVSDVLSAVYGRILETVLCGDFNFPHADWTNGTVRSGALKEERVMTEDLAELAEEFFRFQQIHEATHRKGNILDLLFSNNPQFIHSYKPVETMYSEHSIVECATKYHPSNIQEAKKQKKYSPAASQLEKLNFFSEDADWMGLNNELKDHNWSEEFRSGDPDSMLRCFIDVCSAAASEYIPGRKAFRKTSMKSRIPREILQKATYQFPTVQDHFRS